MVNQLPHWWIGWAGLQGFGCLLVSGGHPGAITTVGALTPPILSYGFL